MFRSCLALTLAVSLVAPAAVTAATPFWDLLAQIKLEEVESGGRWSVKKTFPEELVAKTEAVEVIGYYVPVEAQAYVRTFLVVPTPAACPFCGDGTAAPSLEVHVRKPMPDMEEGTRVRLRGMLRLIDSDETYQSVILTDAALVE